MDFSDFTIIFGAGMLTAYLSVLVYKMLRNSHGFRGSSRPSVPSAEIQAYYKNHLHPNHIIMPILAEIPEGEYHKLQMRLHSISNVAQLTDPENMNQRWEELRTALQEELGIADTSWKQNIAAIMARR